MNARAWASTANLVLAERITEQRRRDQGQPRLNAGPGALVQTDALRAALSPRSDRSSVAEFPLTPRQIA